MGVGDDLPGVALPWKLKRPLRIASLWIALCQHYRLIVVSWHAKASGPVFICKPVFLQLCSRLDRIKIFSLERQHEGFHRPAPTAKRKLGQVDPVQQFADIIRLYASTVVLKWSTTAKSGGKAIEATDDNFVALMQTQAFRRAFQVFQEDCSDLANFRAKQEEGIAKN